MAGRSVKPNTGGFDPVDKVNSSTLKRHPKMELSRTDLLQLLSYLEGELQARDVAIATLKAEKAKQLLYQAKYGRFGLGDPFSAMQRDSDNMKDNTFDESAIKSMYDNQLAQLENLIATQRKAQMKMREQMLAGEKRYQKVCSELDDEKRKHAQDTAQGDDVTYMLEKERERLKQEIDFEKSNQKKMEKDMKKTLASLEEERANSSKHKQVALMLIKERKKLVETMVQDKYKAEQAERLLQDERNKSMNMAEGLVQESKKSLKMEATMERQASEFDLEREQLKNKLHREENRNKDLQAQIDSLAWQLENLQTQLPNKSVHNVELKSSVLSPQPSRLSSERTWPTTSQTHSGKSGSNIVEREAGLSPRTSTDLTVRKHDNTRYTSPQVIDRGHIQYSDNSEQRVAPIGAVSDSSLVLDTQSGHKVNVSVGGPTMMSSGGKITVQTGGNVVASSGPVSPRRMVSVARGTPPPIPPNKPVLASSPVTKPIITHKSQTVVAKSTASKPVHIPVSVVHTTTASTSNRTQKHEGSPSSLRKPTQFTDEFNSSEPQPDVNITPPTSDSFDFLGQEMADLQQLLVSMVTVPSYSTGMSSSVSSVSSINSSSYTTGSPLPDVISSTSLPDSSISTSVTLSMTSSNENMTSSTSPIATMDNSSSTTIPSTSSVHITSPQLPMTSLLPFDKNSRTPMTTLMTSQKTSSSAALQQTFRNQHNTSSSFVTYQNAPIQSVDQFSQQKQPVNAPVMKQHPHNSSTIKQSFIGGPNAMRHSMDNFHVKETRSSSQHQHHQASGIVNISVHHSLDSKQYSDTMTASTVINNNVVKDIPSSPIHRYAAMGNLEMLNKLIVELEADVNLPMKDGTTPAHCAAENGQEACLTLLIQQGCHVNNLRDDQQTPLHCAAAYGHLGCLRLLLSHGAKPNLPDQSGLTPLHWASSYGNIECCKKLLAAGAKRLSFSNSNWTPFHMAVHSMYPGILDLLFNYENEQSEKLADIKHCLYRLIDKDGWTLAHLAASKESPECLSVILKHCDMDLEARDKWGKTVLDVSTINSRPILLPYVYSAKLRNVTIEIQCSGPLYMQQEPFTIGHVCILPNMSWHDVDMVVTDCIENYFERLDHGFWTKKIQRLDPEINGGDSGGDFSLELNINNISVYNIGTYCWDRQQGNHTFTVQQLLSHQEVPVITVNLKDDLSSLAFDLLLPISSINNYTRLLDQYKSVVFYGPEGTRKKQLIKRLARYVAEKEKTDGVEPRISQVYLHSDFKHIDFIKLLQSEGCMLPSGRKCERPCILLLFNLEKVNLTEMLGNLLEHLEYRGNHHNFLIQGSGAHMFHFPSKFYLIATMDKPRSSGVDLGLQQRFRWVHFRVKVEPIKNLLSRHLLRRLLHTYNGELPPVDGNVFKSIEWLLCVWQRLNDGVSKLGLPDTVFGPDMFLPCPVESRDSKIILEWLRKLWNETISPIVRTAVIKGTGKDSSIDGQHKVASTALYVLLQRVIVPGCPLNGPEKDEYLSLYSGSNELDIPLKHDKTNLVTTVNQRRPIHNGSHGNNTQHQSRPKHRNSTDGNFLTTYSSNNNNNNNMTYKRRSLSQNSTSSHSAGNIEIPVQHDTTYQQHSSVQSKVPKLEIRSPVLGLTISLPNTVSANERSSPLRSVAKMSANHSSSQRRSTFSSSSRIPQPSSKRSRSSENLNVRSLQQTGQFQPTSPFSFSLATPNSSLFSFKFYDETKTRQEFEC
ncbi:hypothetical protein ACF0H5_014348 [Mactra antiquata]